MILQLFRKPRDLVGHVDAADRYHIAGWAAYPGGIAPQLRISVDGTLLTQLKPRHRRADLANQFGANIRLGFDHVFDPPLPGGATISVTDRYGRHIMGSPVRIETKPEPDLSGGVDGLSTPVPPAELIFLVVGHRDRLVFGGHRRPAVDYIVERLNKVGVDVGDLRTILDFGCGCGRILAGWEGRLGNETKLIGCDINPRLVDFCKANIPFATTYLSDYWPPLRFLHGGEVDFAYAASVFTHLTPDATAKWAAEMARVIRPNGHLILSFHGATFNAALAEVSDEGPSQLAQHGIYTHLHEDPDQTQLGSNHYATFMTREFVASTFREFEVLDITSQTPNAFMSAHDIAMLRRRVERS